MLSFNSSLTFREISLDYIEKNPNPEAGEYYIAPIYQHAIEEGFKVKYIPAKNVKLFGTPAQLLSTFNIENFALLSENSWSGHQRGTLVVDVDNTLSVRPNGLGYESCVPIRNAATLMVRTKMVFTSSCLLQEICVHLMEISVLSINILLLHC